MQSKVYTSFKNIKNLLDNTNLLQGEIQVKSSIGGYYYIPICSVRLNKYNKNHFLFSFNTLDTHTGNIKTLDYDSFINYMHIAKRAGFGDFKHHQVGPIGWDTTVVDYVSGNFTMDTKLIRYSFKLNKKQFYLIKILSPNEHNILLLCSPDTTESWINKLGTKRYNLSKNNIDNIITLLHYHLFNQPSGLKITNSQCKFEEVMNFNKVEFKNHNLITINSDFGHIFISLIGTRAYIDTPTNARPRIVFEYKNRSKNNLKVSIILASKYRIDLINKLTR